jgi:hypothetical protein
LAPSDIPEPPPASHALLGFMKTARHRKNFALRALAEKTPFPVLSPAPSVSTFIIPYPLLRITTMSYQRVRVCIIVSFGLGGDQERETATFSESAENRTQDPYGKGALS